MDRRQWTVACLLVLAMVIDGLDIQLLALVSPLVLAELSIERAAFGPAMAAALLGMALGASVGGWLGDRFGRRRVLVLSMLGFGLATCAVSLCHEVWSIALLRLVGGTGFGAAAPCAMALITEWLPDRYRARAVSALAVGTPLGGLLGSVLLIGWLPLLGWRNAFIVCGAVSGLMALLVWWLVPESPVLARRRAQADPSRPGLAAVFTTPSLRFVVGAGLAFIGVSYVAYAFAAWSPVMLTSAGFSVPQALKASLGFNLMAVAAALLTGLLADRHGTRRLMFVAGTVVLLAVLLMAVAVLQHLGLRGETAYAAVLVASSLAGGATGSVLAATYTVLASGYPPQMRATGLGIGLMIGRVGGIASTFTGGLLLAVPGLGALPLFLVLAGCALLALLGIGLIDHHVEGASGRVAR